MRVGLATLLVALTILSGCGPSAEQRAQEQADAQRIADEAEQTRIAEEARQAQAKAEQACVLAAVRAMAVTGSTSTLLDNVNAANLTTCPTDFGVAYTDYRGKFALAADKAREADTHAAGGSDAAGAGVAVTILEGLMGESTGATPFSDWNRREGELGGELKAAFDALAAAKQAVLVSAARSGVTSSTAPAAPDDAMMTNAM